MNSKIIKKITTATIFLLFTLSAYVAYALPADVPVIVLIGDKAFTLETLDFNTEVQLALDNTIPENIFYKIEGVTNGEYYSLIDNSKMNPEKRKSIRNVKYYTVKNNALFVDIYNYLDDTLPLNQIMKTNGNLSNYGLVATDEKHVFFSGNGLFRSPLINDFSSIQTNAVKLADDIPLNINIVGDQIFYYNIGNIPEDAGIYRINIDGTSRQRISKDSAYGIVVYKDWIYYISKDENSQLFRIAPDGTNKQNITQFSCEYLNIVDDAIYVSNASDGKTIYKISIDGTLSQKLSDDNAWFLNVSSDGIFYTTTNDLGKICKMNLDGTNKTILNNEISFNINLQGKYIYYYSIESNILKRINIDGTNPQDIISAPPSQWFNVINENVYYFLTDTGIVMVML